MEWLVVAVGLITVLSALVQLALPEGIMALSGIGRTPATIYLFRLSSLLTGLFGGMLLHTFLSGRQEQSVYLWVILQKLLGVVLVLLGVSAGTLLSAALLVAAYDSAAGLFLLWYFLNRIVHGR